MLVIIIVVGFILDAIFGDPVWLWHPVRAIGMLITKSEAFLRARFPKNPKSEKKAGILLWIIVCGISFFVPLMVLWAVKQISMFLYIFLQIWFCYQIFAHRALRNESNKVYKCLSEENLEGAREAVSYIVGRDTDELDEEGVTKATVETISENASDGVVAPMFFLFLGGVPLGFLYKAVNTLDSMVGYKNEKYLNFGWFSARMDDIFNVIPARICALAMILGAKLLGFDARNAYRIWRRDRHCHASPNSAQTEAACAGALHIQLAGNASYFGKLHYKPTIGDKDRPIEGEDIDRTNRLMTVASIIVLLLLGICALILELEELMWLLWN